MVRVGGRPTDYTEPLPTADRMDGLQVTILHEAPVSAPPPPRRKDLMCLGGFGGGEARGFTGSLDLTVDFCIGSVHAQPFYD